MTNCYNLALLKNGYLMQQLVQQHNLHAGVYARVAEKMGVDASYVSRVANGERESLPIQAAIIEELEKLQGNRPLTRSRAKR